VEKVSVCILKYHGAREIPWEAGVTTLQG
jgi:hypothetical protein